MSIAWDHASTVPASRGMARLTRAIRARLAEFHRYWFVDCVVPNDPPPPMSPQDLADLPTWHPVDADD